MRRLTTLLILTLAGCCWAATGPTNVPTSYLVAVTVDTNGVLKNPTAEVFFASNSIPTLNVGSLAVTNPLTLSTLTGTGILYADGTTLTNKADFNYIKATKQVTADNLLVNGAYAGDYNIARFGSNTSTMLMFTESSKEFSFTAGSNGTAYPNAIFGTTNTRLPFVTLTEDCWGDSMVPSMAFKTGATAPSFSAFGPSGTLLCYAFAGSGTDDQVYFTIQLNHDYKEGTTIYPHHHWAETATTTAGTAVIWGLEYSIASPTGTFGAPSTIYTTNAVSGTNWKHQIASFPTISGSGLTVSCILVGRLFRLQSSGADTYDKEAASLGFDIHYRFDTLGSRNETSK